MVTIGYGDISPINPYEKVYVVAASMFACGVFGYAINAIGSIV